MKKGLILYITGSEPQNCDLNPKKIARMIGSSDSIEFISQSSGRSDVHEAWLNLIVKGSSSIKCRFGSFNERGTIVLNDRELRLC